MDNSGIGLRVEVTDKLFSELRQVAKQRYGDANGETVDRIVAEALEQGVERYGVVDDIEEIKEPVAEWVPEPDSAELVEHDSIQTWLFRGRR